MTTNDPTSARLTSRGRLAFASGVGSAVEFYDFAIYGTATALVFTDTFFRTDNAWLSTFMGLATFGIGFLMGPIGAVLFGWVGDRYGRRRALMLTFLGMGAATVLMGLLPTYALIGVAAPVLLVILRLIHGLTAAGEIGGAAVLAIEHAPAEKRARYGVFVALGAPVGTILANIAFALVLLAPAESVQNWVWRLPFLFGGVVLLIGLWLRKGVAESPVFQEMMREKKGLLQKQAPLLQVFRVNWRRVLLGAGVSIGINSMAFVMSIYMLSYATAPAPEGLSLPRQPIVIGSIAALLLHAAANVLSAFLSDRIGRRPVMIGGAVASIAAALFIFHLAAHGTLASVNAAMAIGFAATGLLFGPLYTYFTELFPPEQRQTGLGVAFHAGAVLGGGMAPMIANRIVATTGQAANIGYYLAGVLLVSLVCLIVLPETAPARTRRTSTGPSASVTSIDGAPRV
ncbi:MHS family MFS transporter [Streptomyces bathyalis]|uniref:MHS family MFS transporter n=1 Tax=Streptomyces bathyalis TaxID=2710756 RepID=A0A7T1T2N3_9ACTN|nr:MFS transporter [Streptomyces bathyalis]QPP05279.1 MHS family MFS transporter [Streptomyces bathyalis]